MKTLKSLTLTLGVALMFSTVASAQNAAQNDQVKQGESCCAMKDGGKNPSAKDGCCCCSGDSCDMKMKESMKNHSAKDGCCCCSGDPCDMKMKDMKNMKHQHKG